jgi:hypothetical protein
VTSEVEILKYPCQGLPDLSFHPELTWAGWLHVARALCTEAWKDSRSSQYWKWVLSAIVEPADSGIHY